MKAGLAITALVLSTLYSSAASAQTTATTSAAPFITGADLSYVNEMEDCGARYSDGGKQRDPFAIFAGYGADLVRVRLWHKATWTRYSNLEDVAKTIRRAKQHKLRVLLDFHYSDTWTDPERQEIPDAWKHITNTPELAKALYDYTQTTLQTLDAQGLAPDMVQVGNETNVEILQPKGNTSSKHLNWERNAALLNSGIKAVRDFSATRPQKIAIVLHIAQPEHGLWWFPEAAKHGITDFDVMGLSYYPQWSKYKVDASPNHPGIGDAIRSLTQSQGKPVMVVETAYPWMIKNIDKADNVMWQDALAPEYPATPKGQLDYLLALSKSIKSAGGIGLIYWEPAWVSTRCKTQWGEGSHWENATFFDTSRAHNSLPAFKFFNQAKP